MKPDGDMLGALWTLSPRGRNRILDEAEGVERMRRGDRQEGGRTGEEAADADRLGDSSDLRQHHPSVRIRSIFRAVPSWGQNMNILITRGTVHIVLLVYTVTCNNVCLVFTTCNTRCIVFTTCNTRWCLLGAKHEHPIPLFYTCQHILNF